MLVMVRRRARRARNARFVVALLAAAWAGGARAAGASSAAVVRRLHYLRRARSRRALARATARSPFQLRAARPSLARACRRRR